MGIYLPIYLFNKTNVPIVPYTCNAFVVGVSGRTLKVLFVPESSAKPNVGYIPEHSFLGESSTLTKPLCLS